MSIHYPQILGQLLPSTYLPVDIGSRETVGTHREKLARYWSKKYVVRAGEDEIAKGFRDQEMERWRAIVPNLLPDMQVW